MSEVIKFPLSELHASIEEALIGMEIPDHRRAEAITLAKDLDQAYQVPVMNPSVQLPPGFTDEQADLVKRELVRQFANYREQLRRARLVFIVGQVMRKLNGA